MPLTFTAVTIALAGSLALLMGLRSLTYRRELALVAAPVAGPLRLSRLGDAQRARVERLDDQCEGLVRRRLLDFGLTPGATIERELSNAFDSAGVYRVRGTLLALRRDQAEHIWVQPVA